MRGRKPTPTALKLVQGNPGKRPLNTEEPQPAAGAPACPAWLSKDAKAAWRWWVGSLDPTKMLTQADRTDLIALCEAEALLKKAQAEVEEHGATVFEVRTESVDGQTIYATAKVNPAVNTMIKAMNTIRSLASEFGGSPSARTRLSTPPAKETGQKQDLLSG